VFADIGKDEVCGDGCDLVKARLAEFSLNVIFGSEAEATMGLYAGVRCLPRGFGCEVFRHVGFGAAGFAGIVEFASAKAHQVRCFGLNVARCDRELQTAFEASRLALPALRATGGAIVNVTASATVRADAGMGAYTAAKSAVSRLTEALAAEEMPNGLRVNAVMPSIIDTPSNRSDMPDADYSRWVSPKEVADVVVFLLSSAASGITGAVVPVVGRVR
jgi:NAD(P)-dependent dehydrogenase (short-subunit alcohol dehydrogenase family)